MGPLDHAFWERIAQGSPLIVMILLGAIGMLWRYLGVRQAAFDAELKDERIAREKLQVETLQAITTMKASLDQNTQATRELTLAIRDRH
jgi:hypothetical protein